MRRAKKKAAKPLSPPPAPAAPKPAPTRTLDLVLAAAAAGLDKKAEEPVVLDVAAISSYADYVLVLSAESERQVNAIARAIEEAVRGLGGRLRSLESAGEAHWLLLDFGDFVVHVFHSEARAFYDLEGLWADAPRVRVPGQAVAAPRRPRR